LDAVSSGLREPLDKMILPGVQLDEALGRKLAAWASGTTQESPAATGMDYSGMLKAADSLETLQDVWKDVYKHHEGKVPLALEMDKNTRKAQLQKEAV
jgi:hypothetical protein